MLNNQVYLWFAHGVRLHWSEVRQQHLLLFPEGVLVLNHTAAMVLAQCKNPCNVDTIVARLSQHFQSINVSDVEYLLSQLTARGLLVSQSIES
jgi:coenzyme PQQ biosynthesis protein PqqD